MENIYLNLKKETVETVEKNDRIFAGKIVGLDDESLTSPNLEIHK